MDKKEYVEKMSRCRSFIDKVAELCGDSWTMVGSCNNDASCYLVPAGTESQITYYGKPHGSLRFSDHWNWYSSTKMCTDEHYVQCRSLDMPWVRHREEVGKATKPRFGIQVSRYNGNDGCYYHVYGDKFDREQKIWMWTESDPEVIAEILMT